MENQEAKDKLPNPLLQMTKADWAAFRHSPGYKLLQVFLKDFQESLNRAAWAHLKEASQPDNTLLLKMATRANVLMEIAELEFESIQQFYGVENEETTVPV